MMTRKICGTLALFLIGASAACGSGDDDDSGGSDSSEPSCKAYCDAQEAAGCGDTSAECYDFECVLVATPPPACQTARTNYYNCLTADADICNAACTAEFDEIFNNCS